MPAENHPKRARIGRRNAKIGGELASELHREALRIGRQIGDPTVTAQALTGLARIALRFDIAEARRLCREALAVIAGTADRLGRSNATHVLGVAAQMAGDLDEARTLMSERIELAREAGNLAAVSSECGNLSMVERQLGNLDRADELAREATESPIGAGTTGPCLTTSVGWRPSRRSDASSSAPLPWSEPLRP